MSETLTLSAPLPMDPAAAGIKRVIIEYGLIALGLMGVVFLLPADESGMGALTGILFLIVGYMGI